jgi:hypothetical protein
LKNNKQQKQTKCILVPEFSSYVSKSKVSHNERGHVFHTAHGYRLVTLSNGFIEGAAGVAGASAAAIVAGAGACPVADAP